MPPIRVPPVGHPTCSEVLMSRSPVARGMSPRIMVSLVLMLLLAGVVDARADQAAVEDVRPDIIVVMVDDLGYIQDDRVLERLPNIRQLWLQGGLRLQQMYDETPLCCPARATFLTGQDTLHDGVTRNDGDLLDPDATIAVALHAAGYHTIQVGKYLNGYSGVRLPVGWDHASIVRSLGASRFWRDGQLVSYAPVFVDDAIRQQAVAWIDDAPTGQPLFQWVSTSAPHACDHLAFRPCYEPPVMTGDQGAAACAGVPDFRPPSYRVWHAPEPFPRQMPGWPTGWKLRSVCESMLVVDRMVGELQQAEAKRGRPAWFVFLSDNGMSWGQKGFPQKHVPSATRLPFYVAGPGVTPGASDALVSNIDIAPTFADIGGARLPHADGTSMLPLLRGEPFTARRSLLEIQTTPDAVPGIYWAAIRTRTWRFIRWGNGRRELYQLKDDPWELHDLYRRHRATADRLEARLDRLIAASR